MKTIWRLLEVGETIQEGDEFYSNTCHLWSSADSEKRGTVCKDHMPYRRRMNAAEIDGNTVYYGVAPVVAKLEKENAELLKWVDCLKREHSERCYQINELYKENEQLKRNQVVWEKCSSDEWRGSYIDTDKNIIRCGDGKGMVCTIPLPTSENEEAEEAWEEYKIGKKWWDVKSVHEAFIAGCRAVKKESK